MPVTTMDITMLLSVLGSILLLSMAIGGLVWKLSSEVATLKTTVIALDGKLNAHIETTKEWREHMIKFIGVKA